jgi:hypothetical protein
LVREVCDYIYVMDFGHEIFQGSPEEAVHSQVVQAAYLGTEGVEAADLVEADGLAASVPAPADALVRLAEPRVHGQVKFSL